MIEGRVTEHRGVVVGLPDNGEALTANMTAILADIVERERTLADWLA